MSKPVRPEYVYCPTCKMEVGPVVPKMFNVKLCPRCSKILASDIPMSKVG